MFEQRREYTSSLKKIKIRVALLKNQSMSRGSSVVERMPESSGLHPVMGDETSGEFGECIIANPEPSRALNWLRARKV